MKTALYLRVSSESQTTDKQLPAIESYAYSRGYEITAIYRENESAWKSGHQHKLSWLLDDVRGGRQKYERVLCFALDRLSRQGPLTVLTLIDSFKSYGVKVESVQEPFMSLPYGFDSVIYSFLAWVAKYESDRKSQNTRAGVDRAMAQGKRLGRPPGKKDHKPRRKKRPVVFKYAGVGVGVSE